MRIVQCNVIDEYYTPKYAIRPISYYIPQGSTVWCPFDKEYSNFVKIFKERGCKVIATHIENGENFFKIERECDYIVSNPPYSCKEAVFKRLKYFDKPYAMLVPMAGWCEGERFDIFKKGVQLMMFNIRINYYLYGKEATAPPFSTMYICKGILRKDLVLVEIRKEKEIFSFEY